MFLLLACIFYSVLKRYVVVGFCPWALCCRFFLLTESKKTARKVACEAQGPLSISGQAWRDHMLFWEKNDSDMGGTVVAYMVL
jgi:hypothetical protein